jgi:hypothetical protein
MSIPFKSKLAYAWARATHKDRLYSHVFEEKVSVPVYVELHDGYGDYTNGDIAGYTDSKISRWLKAVPMEGAKSGQFLLIHESFQSYPHTYTTKQLGGVYTQDQVLGVIKAWEEKQLKAKNMLASRKQPFKAFIKTSLAV